MSFHFPRLHLTVAPTLASSIPILLRPSNFPKNRRFHSSFIKFFPKFDLLPHTQQLPRHSQVIHSQYRSFTSPNVRPSFVDLKAVEAWISLLLRKISIQSKLLCHQCLGLLFPACKLQRFVEEENRHNIPMKPITKEEVEAMKARFREIEARPAKKVAQAKARKKRATMKQLDKVRQKSNTISGQTDISEVPKQKMIDQLYKRVMPERPKKELVVAMKGVQETIGKGKKLVDRRMKKVARTKGSGKPGKRAKLPKRRGRKDAGPKQGGKMNHLD